jgi:hypothetical protein
MFLLFNLGVFLWLIYGIALGSAPIILANTVTLALALTILALKLRYDRDQRSRVRDQGTDISWEEEDCLEIAESQDTTG